MANQSPDRRGRSEDSARTEVDPSENGTSAERYVSPAALVTRSPTVTRPWTDRNNELLRARVAEPNVVLIDWDSRADECEGSCLAADGLHLATDGREFYADLIRDVTGV